MSLDFSFKKCRESGRATDEDLYQCDEDGEPIKFDDGYHWSAAAFSMPWLMMAIGKQNITEKNADEVWRRTWCWQQLHGTMAMLDGKSFYLTKEHIYKFIGMTTNCFPELSDTAFNKKVTQLPY